jgi:6-pyruvoyltetrahydropterin/6-carboxytetrahydropterin synthase
MMTYQSTKTYGYALGLSCCFRQWRAESHCRFLHGYSLAFKFTFETDELDVRGWVVDFGSLKSLKGILEDTFDHKLLVAEDDPEIRTFLNIEKLGLVQVRKLPAVGCEKFAEYVFGVANAWLASNGYAPRVRIKSVEVMEHGANSAIYTGLLG